MLYDYIEGRLVRFGEEELVIETGGIGYFVYPSQATVRGLSANTERAKVYVHLEVKEDDLALYGFANRQERALFRMILSVSRIGPKTGLQILSSMGKEEFREAIMREEEGTLTTIKGIGKKTARRLILELKDDLPELEMQSTTGDPHNGSSGVALQALTSDSLGFSFKEAREAISKVQKENGDLGTQELIQKALKELS